MTNPPIDPLRETVVMSLETCLGAERNVFDETPEHANRVILSTPVLSPGKFQRLKELNRPGFETETLSLSFSPEMGLEAAVRSIADQAEAAVRAGKVWLILSDANLEQADFRSTPLWRLAQFIIVSYRRGCAVMQTLSLKRRGA